MSDTPSDASSAQPWSTKSPQRWIFVAVTIVIAVAVVITAVSYITAGTGGVVPFLMVAVAPVLAVVYVWYFGFKRW